MSLDVRSLPFIVTLVSGIIVAPASALAQGVRESGTAVVTLDTVREARVIGWHRLARIGHPAGDEAYILARVSALTVDREAGEVFVLDGLDHRVKVYSVDGVFLRAWGRKGEGPGEFMAAMGIAAARDTVIVSDGHRVHTFRASGEHLATVVPRASLPVTLADEVHATAAGWRLTLREIEPGVTGATPFQRTYALSPTEGIPLQWLYQVPHPGSAPSGVLAHVATASPHGEGFVDAPSERYELRVLDSDGTARAVHRFEHRRVPVRASAKREYEEVALEGCKRHAAPALCLDMIRDGLRSTLAQPLPRFRPVVGRLLGSQDELILVQRSDLDPTPFSPGGANTWDLIGNGGRWLGQVRFPARFSPGWLGDGQVWGVELDELDVPYVVGLRLDA